MKWLLVAVLLAQTTPSGAAEAGGRDGAVLLAVAPPYPATFREARVQKTVKVRVTIDARGMPLEARPDFSVEPIARSFEATALQWRFQPAVDAGSGPRTVELVFVFRIAADGVPDEALGPVFKPPYTVEVSTRGPRPETVS